MHIEKLNKLCEAIMSSKADSSEYTGHIDALAEELRLLSETLKSESQALRHQLDAGFTEMTRSISDGQKYCPESSSSPVLPEMIQLPQKIQQADCIVNINVPRSSSVCIVLSHYFDKYYC